MDLSANDIEEFREAWRRDFGELLSEGEARHQASRLLDFLLLLAQPCLLSTRSRRTLTEEGSDELDSGTSSLYISKQGSESLAITLDDLRSTVQAVAIPTPAVANTQPLLSL